MRLAPRSHSIHMLRAAEVTLVFRLAEPTGLAGLLARRTAVFRGAISRLRACAWVAAKQLPAAQASTSYVLFQSQGPPGLHHDQRGRDYPIKHGLLIGSEHRCHDFDAGPGS